MSLTKDSLEQMVVQEGLSFSKISQITGVNVGQISNMAKRFNIISTHMSSIISRPLPIAEIYQKYVDGKSLDALHKEYKTPVARIKKHLKRAYPDIVFRSMDEAKRPAELNDCLKLAEYTQKNVTCREIAKILGVKEMTVLAAFKRVNVERFKYEYEPLMISKDDLNELYWGKMMSSIEIAGMYGLNATGVIGQLHKHNIPVRGIGGARVSKHKELNEQDWLHEEYVVNERSMNVIASELHTTIGNVAHYLRKYEIPIRSKEEIYERLQQTRSEDATGTKGVIETRFGIFHFDSLLEKAFIEMVDASPAKEMTQPDQLSHMGLFYKPDFKVDGQVVEVKPKSMSRYGGCDRQKLIKQYLIARGNGITVKVWNGSYMDVELCEDDTYYCLNWKLLFSDHVQCSDWLLKFGFKSIRYPRDVLVRAIKKSSHMEGSLEANTPNSDVLSLLKHFSGHYYHSHHKGYNPISAAWGLGNQNVLKQAVEMLWDDSQDINIYGLVKMIGKSFKDFSPISIFKPWVASFIYNKLLPSGGTVVDPCMGWGGRLLGCLDKNIKYHGLDLNQNGVQANADLRKFLGHRIGEATFGCSDSSLCDFPSADLLFTSPPYDSTEHYFGIDSSKTKTEPILDNIFKKFNGIVVLNIPRRMQDLTIVVAQSRGWRLSEELQMKTSSFMGREKTYEPILIFRK